MIKPIDNCSLRLKFIVIFANDLFGLNLISQRSGVLLFGSHCESKWIGWQMVGHIYLSLVWGKKKSHLLVLCCSWSFKAAKYCFIWNICFMQNFKFANSLGIKKFSLRQFQSLVLDLTGLNWNQKYTKCSANWVINHMSEKLHKKRLCR